MRETCALPAGKDGRYLGSGCVERLLCPGEPKREAGLHRMLPLLQLVAVDMFPPCLAGVGSCSQHTLARLPRVIYRALIRVCAPLPVVIPMTGSVEHGVSYILVTKSPLMHPRKSGRLWGSHVAPAAARRQQHETPPQLPQQQQQQNHTARDCRSVGVGSQLLHPHQACRKNGRALRPRWRRPPAIRRRRKRRHWPLLPTFQR